MPVVDQSEQQAVPVAQSPASIWLSPICDETAHHGEGRTWASPAPDVACEDCGLPWVEYVRADIALPCKSGEGAGEREAIARIVYAAMQWAADQSCTDSHPQWVEGGNSFAQDEARTKADAILALTPDATQTREALQAAWDRIDSLPPLEFSVDESRKFFAALNARGGA